MITKTVTIEGQEYVLGPISVGVARSAQLRAKTGLDFNIALVSASLQAGGDPNATEAFVEDIPFFNVFGQLLIAACDINGIKSVAAKPAGESQPEAGPAASTSATSTVQ
jgi:hypothetical protein